MRKKNLTILLVFLILVNTLTLNANPTSANFEGWIQNCIDYMKSNIKKKKDGDTETSGDTPGVWTKEGTKANDIAWELWDYWKDKGFGGPAISGVMGNVAHEGGFDIPDRAEGHYGGNSETDGIAYGNIPATMEHYPIGKTGNREGGAGHYQFTPYSKYAPVGDDSWLSTKKQSDYVWTSEVGHANWLSDYIELSSVETSVEEWFYKYERGMSLNPAKIDSGKEAYQLFGGADISADSSLANAVDTAKDGEEKEKKKKGIIFGCGSSSDNSSSGPRSGADSELAEIAESLLGYFTYALIHGEKFIGSVDNIDKNGVTDCSGFIWLVFSLAGYKVPGDMGWFTGSMEDDARGKGQWLEEISAEEATAGDIVIVTSAGKIGHTAMLLEDWQDAPPKDNKTEIIQMGGISMDGVNQDAFNSSFNSLVNSNHTITFARGIEE